MVIWVQIPLGSPLKKSAIEALFLCVMRSEVIIASQIDLSDAMLTQQVTDAQLLSVLSKNAKLLSQTPIQAAGIKTCRFSLFSKPFSEFECLFFENRCFGYFFELAYKGGFIFQYIKRVRISLGLWDT